MGALPVGRGSLAADTDVRKGGAGKERKMGDLVRSRVPVRTAFGGFSHNRSSWRVFAAFPSYRIGSSTIVSRCTGRMTRDRGEMVFMPSSKGTRLRSMLASWE